MAQPPSTPNAHDEPAAPRGAPGSSRRRRRWPRIVVIAAVTLAALYVLIGFVGVPLLLRHVAAPRLSRAIDGTVELRHAAFNPFTFVVRLEGARVHDRAGDEVLGFERFEADFQLVASLLHEGLHLRHGRLTAPSATVIIRADGSVNLAELLGPPSAREPAEPAALPRLVAEAIDVRDGRILFRDESPVSPVEKEVTQLAFRIDLLDTAAGHSNEHALEATLASGERLAWTGRVVVAPLAATGEIALRDVPLASLTPYAAPLADAAVVGGTLDLEIGYDLAPLADPPRATATLKQARVVDLLVQHDGRTLADIATIEVGAVAADVVTRSLRVGAVSIEPRTIHVRRGADGAFELAGLPAVARSDARPAPPGAADVAAVSPVELRRALAELVAGASGRWSIALERVDATGGRLVFDDLAPREPVSVVLEQLALSGGPLREDGAVLPFRISGLLGGADPLSVEGLARLDASSIELSVVTEGIDVAWAAPYLPRELPEPAPPAALRSARLRLDGTASLGRAAGGADARWSGAVGLLALELVDPETGAMRLRSDAVSLDGTASARAGAAALEAMAFEGTASVQALALDAPSWAGLTARVGTLASTLAVEVERRDADRLRLDVKGQLEATGLAAAAPARNDLAATLDRAVVTGIHLDTGASALAVGDVLLETPSLRAIAVLLAAEESADPIGDAPPAAAERPPPALRLQIGHAAVRDGSVNIRDSGAAAVAIGLEQLTADVSNIVNDGYTPAEVKLESRVGESGRVRLAGTADLFRAQPFADVILEAESLRLTRYSVFGERYLGYAIEAGRGSATIPLTLGEGRYRGELDARLERFRLGKKVAGPSAPSAPLKLGLSLLRDKDDVVGISVPFAGEAAGSSFRLAPVIGKALAGALTKTAKAPFTMIAGIFAGSPSVDLSQVEFAPGSAELDAAAAAKLDALGAAVREHPSLRLAMSGHASRAADVPALREAALRALLLERLRRERPAAAVLDEASETDMIAELHAERLGTERRLVPVPPGSREQRNASVASMRAALLETIEITPERLLELARARSDAAAADMAEVAGTPPLLRAPVIDEAAAPGRVTFEFEDE